LAGRGFVSSYLELQKKLSADFTNLNVASKNAWTFDHAALLYRKIFLCKKIFSNIDLVFMGLVSLY
jgi:hypothetical protein